MSIFGRDIHTILNEKDVPVQTDGGEETNYDIGDEGEETGGGKTVSTEDDGTDYNLPEEEDEEPEEDSDYDLPPEEDEGGEEDEEGTDEPNEDNPPEDDPDAESDYDLPGDTEDEGEEGDTGEDTEGDEATEDDEDLGDDEESTEEDPTEELFADLTDEQKAIRDKELSENYHKLYNLISEFVVKLNKVPRTKDTVQKYEFISEKTEILRTTLYDYIISTYSTKSYIENHKNYYEFLATFNQFVRMLEEMVENREENE